MRAADGRAKAATDAARPTPLSQTTGTRRYARTIASSGGTASVAKSATTAVQRAANGARRKSKKGRAVRCITPSATRISAQTGGRPPPKAPQRPFAATRRSRALWCAISVSGDVALVARLRLRRATRAPRLRAKALSTVF